MKKKRKMKHNPHQIKGFAGTNLKGGLSQITDSLLIFPQLNKIDKRCSFIQSECSEIISICDNHKMVAIQEKSDARLLGENWRRISYLDLKYNRNLKLSEREKNERNSRIMLHTGYSCGDYKQRCNIIKVLRELDLLL